MIEAKEQQKNEESILEGPIKTLTKTDVLCGRGSGPNDHCGNIAFRKLVSTRRKEYLLTPTRAQKAHIAREIADVLWNLEPPSRFLEKVTETSWTLVSKDKALEKVKQALRQMRHRKAESLEHVVPLNSRKSGHRRTKSAPPKFDFESFASWDSESNDSFSFSAEQTTNNHPFTYNEAYELKKNRGERFFFPYNGRGYNNITSNCESSVTTYNNGCAMERNNGYTNVHSKDRNFEHTRMYDGYERSDYNSNVNRFMQVERFSFSLSDRSYSEPYMFHVTKTETPYHQKTPHRPSDNKPFLPRNNNVEDNIYSHPSTTYDNTNRDEQSYYDMVIDPIEDMEPQPFSFERNEDSMDEISVQACNNILDALEGVSDSSLPDFT